MQALVLDPRRLGSVAERAAYLRRARGALPRGRDRDEPAGALPTWEDRSPAWVDEQLALVTAVVHQLGTLRGEYDDARAWGDRVLALGAERLAARRADLMLHLSELHRVTGN